MNPHSPSPPNRLITEKSPYLLQHAHNPVAWYPWGDEAFHRAQREDKPLFLSIGYSTCHWCHVMERESFENNQIASILNEHFISIKVDREERPDVDKIYMNALHGMGQQGGWPLSMFLTPDLRPFYGGTYFPPVDGYGRIAFPTLLQRIAELWKNERSKVLETAYGITLFLADMASRRGQTGEIEPDVFDRCADQLKSSYDSVHGGFGSAPKFPRPAVLDFLLRHYHATGDSHSLEMALHTLRAMAEGGMCDQLGGGFHRYSVDRHWFVPHFEKMLYDQAQLATTYLDAFLITNDVFYATVARRTLDYILREMTSPDGGFYSAEDADSPDPDDPEHSAEGAFYVWKASEIAELLDRDSYLLFAERFGVREEGNVEADPHGEFRGKNILSVRKSLAEISTDTGQIIDEIGTALENAQRGLLEHRATRPRPHLDDKIITSWNGLMIGAFARGHQVLGDDRYLEAAIRSAAFLFAHMCDEESGKLKRRYREGEARHDAVLDDYVFLAHGLLDLYQATFDAEWLQKGEKLMESAIRLFWDETSGGFYDSSGSDTTLLVRMKEQYDGAEPTGNSVAALNLLRLSSMTSRTEWREKAERTVRCFAAQLNHASAAIPLMLSALRMLSGGMKQVILVGERGEEKLEQFLAMVRKSYMPDGIVMLVNRASPSLLSAMHPFLGTLQRIDGEPTAYLCTNNVCQLPTADPEVLAGQLAGSSAPSS